MIKRSEKLLRPAAALAISAAGLAACGAPTISDGAPQDATPHSGPSAIARYTPPAAAQATPEAWPSLTPLPLDPDVERRIDDILPRLTLEQKVGQIIQADSGSVTPQEVRDYRLGSVLSGGNSAPGPLPYAEAEVWLEAADAYFNASIDTEGVDIAIPLIWGIDAVHGHANLRGAVVFPHNIGLGAANNPDLIEEIYRVTARELLVSGHDWTFAPTLAVPRDDRWGRTYEGFSEDPGIVRAYGERIVWGLQGRLGSEGFMGPDRVISSAKHFVADGGTETGRDQGDALIDEAELRDIHAAGYYSAIPAGALTVMASFSSWNGARMHGNESLLTDVLKGRMGFNGFVVGDWNGHGLIPGCEATDCPESFNAGVDMFMAPNSWRDLYYNTLDHVRSGRISMERLDDAVRRILRVKIQAGVFELPTPSERPFAGDTELLGSAAHRAVARQAVRESLVLLKNNEQTLPIDPNLTVLVVGDGADSIAKASGGWTLSWQGGGYPNEEFPAGQSILSGVREVVEAAGGTVIFDPEGASQAEADVVVAVYGEDPYAEFQGDRDHLDFVPQNFDPAVLAAFRERDIPVVSVFLSGRPLWTNPELNLSDAFIAAWLPGSEGAGVADMLFRTEADFEFTGRLSFSWPRTATGAPLNVGQADYDPLFAFGYGLSYGSDLPIGLLSEESGLAPEDLTPEGTFYARGQAISPWRVSLASTGLRETPGSRIASVGRLQLGVTERTSQEDALLLSWDGGAGDRLTIGGAETADLARQSNGAMELVFRARSAESADSAVEIGMGCASGDDCEAFIPLTIAQGAWSEYRIGLSCFAEAGVDMTQISEPFILRTVSRRGVVGLSDIALGADLDARRTCGDATR